MFQSYSDYVMEADAFYSQNSFQILMQLTWRCCCRLKSVIANTRIPRGKNTRIMKTKKKKNEEILQLIELSSDKGLDSTFNSKSNSKFWIRMKNEYPNLHDIAVRFLLCFSTTYLCEIAFSAVTVLKSKQKNRLQLCVFVWLSLQFIWELIS